MDADLAHLIHTARGTLNAAQASIEQALSDLETARRSIAELQELAHANVIANLPASTAPIVEHRRLHRAGSTAKIDADPELRAFVVARIDRLSFRKIAGEVTLQFPVERHVKQSAIHTWWTKNRKRHTSPAQPDRP